MKILLLVIVIIIVGAIASTANIIPGTGNNATDSNVVITYGETTYNNNDYKTQVFDYLSSKATVSLDNAESQIITADEVNKISQGISHQTYNSNQIFSSALVELENNDQVKVVVDSSKINLVTAEMYGNALESAGINQGYVVVTSPVDATGESALAGILNCYESATNTQIPDNVKEAANEEVYMQAEVVNNTNLSGNQVSDLVSQVKDEVQQDNISDTQDIVNIIEEIASKNNLNISAEQAQNIADSLSQSQSVQDDAQNYQKQLNSKIQQMVG